MAQGVVPSGTVTFLFTDIEGSTRLWELHPEKMAMAVERHDRVLRDVIESHSGHVFTTAGDAFAAAFARVGDGLAAASSAQRALGAVVWPEPVEVRVRMGVHVGEAQERDGDYFGPVLNRAARLMSAGHGGQVLASAAVVALAGAEGMVDLDEHRLKDLTASERVWQLGAASFPPLRTLEVVRHNLPVQRTELLGREVEIEEVASLVSVHRLVTLTGPGGAGKTRLALAVAAELLEGFGDGVFLVDLAPLSDGALIPDAAMRAAGMSMEGAGQSGRSPTEFAAAVLSRRDVLLLVDNCEHVIEAAAEFSDVALASGAGAKVLATSREVLDVDGEHVYRVPPLVVDPGLRGGGPAVELYVERAAASGVDLDPGDETIGRICRRLDGSPLAIKLAAAQTPVMRPVELEARLDQRLELLVGGRGRQPGRHHTLRVILDASWDQLSGPERDLLAQLSVFAGGWTLFAAEATCVVDGPVPVLMRALVDKSLVEVDGTGDVARFGMLETVRLYASDRLGDLSAACRDRHLGWLARWARSTTVDDHWCDRVWRSAYVAELDNVRDGIRWALQRGRPDDAASLIAAGALAWWEGWGAADIEPLARQAIAAAPTPQPELLFTQAHLAFATGDHRRMAQCCQEAIDAAQVVGQHDVLAGAQTLLSFITANIDADESFRLSERAVHNAAESGASRIQALALAWGSVSLLARGNYDEAIARCEHGLALDPDPESIVGYMANIIRGFAYATAGSNEQARSALTAAEDSARRGQPHQLSVFVLVARFLPAFIAANEGDRQSMHRYLDDALDISQTAIADTFCVADVVVAVAQMLDRDNPVAAADVTAALHGQPFSSPLHYIAYRRLRNRLHPPNPPQQPLISQQLHNIADQALRQSYA